MILSTLLSHYHPSRHVSLISDNQTVPGGETSILSADYRTRERERETDPCANRKFVRESGEATSF